jgi:hypothetical protein
MLLAPLLPCQPQATLGYCHGLQQAAGMLPVGNIHTRHLARLHCLQDAAGQLAGVGDQPHSHNRRHWVACRLLQNLLACRLLLLLLLLLLPQTTWSSGHIMPAVVRLHMPMLPLSSCVSASLPRCCWLPPVLLLLLLLVVVVVVGVAVRPP